MTQHDTSSHPVIISERFKALLRRELGMLINEFNFAGSARRRAISKQAAIILELIREDRE